MTAATVQSLIADDAFVSEHWGRSPLLIPAAEVLDPPAGAEQVLDLLRSRALRPPYLRVVGGPGKGLLPKEQFTKSRPVGHGWADDSVLPEVVADAFRRGATLVLDEVQDYLPALARFCEALSARLGLRFHASVFVTPPGSQGLDLHFDREEVFVQQLAGSKAWRVYPQLQPLRPQSRTLSEDVGEPLIEHLLQPGDLLYVPICSPHVAVAVESMSIHLSIAARPPAWGELLTDLCRDLTGQYAWSTEYPVGPPRTDAYEAEFAAYAGELADALSSFNPTAVLGGLLAGTARPEPGSTALADLLDGLDSVTRWQQAAPSFRLTEGVTAVAAEQGERITLALGERLISVPGSLRPLLDRLRTGARADELRGLLADPDGIERLLGSLVLQGYVATETGGR